MAGSSIQSITKFAGYSLAGAAAVIFIGALAIAMLVLSLIPIYVPDTSDYGYGEVYKIPGFAIKAIYTNVTYNFTGGSVIGLAELSSICTAILSAKKIPGFYACVATNFSAYGPAMNLNATSGLKRRQIDNAALYEVGDLRLLFSNTCANKRAVGNWSKTLTQRQNSSCVAQRAAICRSFIATPNSVGLGNQWLPFPAGYTQLVIANITGSGCTAISITSIFNVPYYQYGNVYSRINGSVLPASPEDCYLESIAPQWALQSLINSETNSNPSACSSFIG